MKMIDMNSLGPSASKPNNHNKKLEADKEISSSKSPAPSVSSNSGGVSLTPEAQQLMQLQTSIDNAPDVNAERVAEVKAALASGQYQVDTQALADKMIDLI